MSNTHNITKYLNYLKFEKRYSSKTIKYYRSIISKLENYGFDYLKLINSEKDLTKNTVRTYHAVIKRFHRYLEQNNLPGIKGIQRARKPKRIISKKHHFPPIINKSKLSKLTNAQQLVIATLQDTGVRKSELFQFRIKNILQGSQVITQKGKKERKIYFSKRVIELAKISLVDPFVGLSSFKLQKLIDSVCDNRVTPHAFRHELATEMLKNGAGIQVIQNFMGHDTIKSTQHYTHLTINQLKSIHKKALSRNNRRN